jgi:hypothetical protein
MGRAGPLALGLLLLSGWPAAAAEKQIRPLVGVTFAGSTTFILGTAVADKHAVFGISGSWIGDIVGVEADLGWVPGVFEPEPKQLVLGSSATTVMGNVVITLPRKWTEYTLRPYVVAGAGLMRVTLQDSLSVFNPINRLAAFDVGGGAIGFLTNRVGLAWDVRRFGTLKGPLGEPGNVQPDPDTGKLVRKVTFWRATMGVVVRY